VIPYPRFGEIGKQATEGVPVAQLLWMALAQLSTKEGYSHLTPEEAYSKVKEIAYQVYQN
jgi:hypothetical protein